MCAVVQCTPAIRAGTGAVAKYRLSEYVRRLGTYPVTPVCFYCYLRPATCYLLSKVAAPVLGSLREPPSLWSGAPGVLFSSDSSK